MLEINLVRQAIVEFCSEFIQHPYLCYTEHGLHALFYNRLYNKFPEETERYAVWKGEKVGVIQKEYPTADKLDKPKRQHWDIAVIKSPLESITDEQSYDYLKLAAVVEFGMNANKEHLQEDIRRVCHPDANLESGFIVHLYRLSKPGFPFSGRDFSADSTKIIAKEDVAILSKNRSVEIYYGVAGYTNTENPSGLWRVHQGIVKKLN